MRLRLWCARRMICDWLGAWMHRAGLAAQARIFTMSRRHFVSALQRTPLFLLACWRSGHPIKVRVPSPIFLRVLTIQIIVLTVALSLGFEPHVSGIKYRHGPLQIMHTSARSWISPISGKPHVIHAFIKPSQRWSAGHRGVDLEATEQDQVRAPAPGTIVFSGTVVDRQVVVIEHPNGYRSSFEPVTDPLPVGTHVQAEQVIARVDAHPAKPRCSTTCLYWSVRRGGDHKNGSGKNAEYINPMLLLGPAEPTILLPVDESFKA